MNVHIILSIILFVLIPKEALAWGPGTHLETALEVIKDISAFSPVIVPLLKKFRDQFIYGMISADIIVGKKYAGILDHCHNWHIGHDIVKKSKNDMEKASAYGYLAHLASDVIAHNYYIPYMEIMSYRAKMRNHTYWEIRFDMHVDAEAWREVKRLIKKDFSGFDDLLESTLKRPLFSFKTNKKIFNTILLLQEFKHIRKAVQLHSRFSQWPLTNQEVKHYKELINRTVSDFLKDPENAKCLVSDPAGHAKLEYAKDIRKTLSNISARNLATDEAINEFIKEVGIALGKTVFDPDAKLPHSYEML